MKRPDRAVAAWVRSALRRLVAPVGRVPRLLVTAACLLVLGMYACNHDMGGDDVSPRGDGKYRPVLARGDGHMLFLMSRSTVFDGDWNFDNDLKRFGDPWNQARTPTGRKGIPHPIGPSLVWAPVLALAQGAAVVANVFGADIPLHGYTPWHQRIVFLTTVVFACGAILFGRRAAQRVIGGAWSPSYAAIGILLGTSLLFYATYMPSYGHAMDAFACAAFLFYWIASLGRRDLGRWIRLGVLLGLATLVRIQELALGVVVAIEIVWQLVPVLRERDAGWRREALAWVGGGALVLAITVVLFIPQLVAWQVVYGDWKGIPQGPRYTRLGHPMILETLFSSRNGWLLTTPIAYLGVIGLFLLPRTARLVALGLVAVVVTQVYLASTIFDWWGSSSFGQRRLCNLTLPLVVGMAAFVWRMGRLAARVRRAPRWTWHVVFVVLVGPFVAWNLNSVGKLGKGKAANANASPSCCGNLPRWMQGPARWIYDRVGNPFGLPGAVVYSVKHGVELRRWDRTVGDYPLIPQLDLLYNGKLGTAKGSWNLGGGGHIDEYVIEGASRSLKADRGYRWTTAPTARFLVPNLMPDGQRYTLWLAPGGATHARVRYSDDVVADVDLQPGWNAVVFDVPSPSVGVNELVVETTPAPMPPASPPPAAPVPGSPKPPPKPLPPFDRPTGVAVGALDMTFMPGVK
jgi:hypothetical protein